MLHTASPLVSIGIPTYNQLGRGRYLDEALESILGQSYQNLEIIISDNASTDDTKELCEKYINSDKRIKYFRQKETIHAVDNFNFVFKKSSGKYFMWAADDDIWDKDFVKTCVESLESDQDAVMAFSNYVRFDEKLGLREECSLAKSAPTERGLYSRLKKHIFLYWGDGKGVPMYGLWRREVVADDALEYYWGFDMNFVFRGLAKGNFLISERSLFLKRMAPSGKVAGNIAIKIFNSLLYRLDKVFSPLFISQIKSIWWISGLSFSKKTFLTFNVFFVVARLFIKRKN